MSTSPFSNDPISKIEWHHTDSLRSNSWNPNCVLDPELRLLERSILQTGWLQPLLINRSLMVIDGFHRWSLSKVSEELKKRYGGMVPCAVLDIPDWEAMMITVRINRAKGTHVAFRMSELVSELVEKHGVDPQQVAIEMGATKDEIELLLQKDVFRVRDIQNYKFSKAWVPTPESKT
jgi:ParB-like chromosome segregation protein Spo0J